MGHVAGLSQSVKLLPGRTRRGGGQAAGAIVRPSDGEGTVRALGASEGYSCWYGSVALKVLHARMRDQSAARAMAMAVPGRPYLRSLISHGDWVGGTGSLSHVERNSVSWKVRDMSRRPTAALRASSRRLLAESTATRTSR